VKNRRNLYAITLPPPFGSLIDSRQSHRRETGLNTIPPETGAGGDPVLSASGIMVGCGLVMLGSHGLVAI